MEAEKQGIIKLKQKLEKLRGNTPKEIFVASYIKFTSNRTKPRDIYNWEKGTSVPSAFDTLMLAKYYNISMQYLCGLSKVHGSFVDRGGIGNDTTRLKTAIGQNIKKLREARNLTHEGLAESLANRNISAEHIKTWEEAKEEPDAGNIFALSTYFNRKVDAICGLVPCLVSKAPDGLTAGQRIKALRQKAGLTMQEFTTSYVQFAGKGGIVKNSSIWLWENDKIVPSAESLTTLAGYFGVTPEYIISGTEKKIEESKKQKRKETGMERGRKNLRDLIEGKGMSKRYAALKTAELSDVDWRDTEAHIDGAPGAKKEEAAALAILLDENETEIAALLGINPGRTPAETHAGGIKTVDGIYDMMEIFRILNANQGTLLEATGTEPPWAATLTENITSTLDALVKKTDELSRKIDEITEKLREKENQAGSQDKSFSTHGANEGKLSIQDKKKEESCASYAYNPGDALEKYREKVTAKTEKIAIASGKTTSDVLDKAYRQMISYGLEWDALKKEYRSKHKTETNDRILLIYSNGIFAQIFLDRVLAQPNDKAPKGGAA